jgi:hypothetical protein
MHIETFINEIIECTNKGDDKDKREALTRYLNQKDISMKGNYFHIKINELAKTRGRPRKKIKLCELDETPLVDTPKIISVSRVSDGYIDIKGRIY